MNYYAAVCHGGTIWANHCYNGLMLKEEIKKFFQGDAEDNEETLRRYSRDASLFEVKPTLVVFPKDAVDLGRLILWAREPEQKKRGVSLTARSGGTCMSGGPLSESIIVDFGRYFNKIGPWEGEALWTEPGVYYRDFEKETLKKELILPSYPASREICMMGGVVANNSGGERTLRYGKTEKYIKKLKVVLADGREHVFEKISRDQLNQKMSQPDFEGDLYRKIFALVSQNRESLAGARPQVSKNSAGYYLWNIWDEAAGTFDLTRIFTGSQGTLGFVTAACLTLVPRQPFKGMTVIFLKDWLNLGEMVNEILKLRPTSLESFDDHTLRLALKFFSSFLELLGARSLFSLAVKFFPEFKMVLFSGLPKLTLLVYFEEKEAAAVKEKQRALTELLEKRKLTFRVLGSEAEQQKYWVVRRESFNLLRHKIKDKQTAPFVDDLIVRPERLPEFLPRLYEILNRYGFLYTIAGHLGDGNFHIIPLMNLAEEKERAKIIPAAQEIYDLTVSLGGSITAEHNDGLIRTFYLPKMFGNKIYALFEETKKIFDADNVFNPGKKIGGQAGYLLSHMKRS